jgi:hypothetical protein
VVPSLASGDTGPLRYSAPAGCPGELDFVRAVAVRGGHFQAGDHDRSFEVTISEDGDGYAGRFRIARLQHSSTTREVRGSSCLEVMDGLAVVTALALQPPAHEAGQPPSPPATHGSALATTPPAPSSEATGPAPAPRPGSERDVPGEVQLGSAFTLTAFGGLSIGLVPSTPMPKYELALTWAALARQANHGRLLGPLLRVALGLHGDVTYDMGGASTTLGAQSLTAGPCYAPLYDEQGFALLTCLELSAGMIGTSTVDRQTNAKHTQTFGFGSVGGALEAEYNLGRHFHLALRAGASALVAPLVVDASDGTELFRSSRYTAYATLGLGGHF